MKGVILSYEVGLSRATIQSVRNTGKTGSISRIAKQPTRITRMGCIFAMAGSTGLEPATSDVTGRRSNQTELTPLSKCCES